MDMPVSFTIHNLEPDVYGQLLARAREQEVSANKIAKKILKEGLGLGSKKNRRDISMLIGMWTKEEGKKFDRYIEEEFERIDEEDWK